MNISLVCPPLPPPAAPTQSFSWEIATSVIIVALAVAFMSVSLSLLGALAKLWRLGADRLEAVAEVADSLGLRRLQHSKVQGGVGGVTVSFINPLDMLEEIQSALTKLFVHPSDNCQYVLRVLVESPHVGKKKSTSSFTTSTNCRKRAVAPHFLE